jgi:hypothetical protein
MMANIQFRWMLLCCLCCGVFAASVRAQNAEATFDDLSPGVYGSTLGDGGISFSNVILTDNATGGFCIDDYSGNSSVTSQPGYTAPNLMSFAYSPGDGGAGAAFQSFDFQLSPDDYGPSVTANFVSLAVFTFNPTPGGIITLEGLLDDSVVGSTSYDVPGTPGSGDVLTLSGTFNSFEVASSGTFNNGYSLAAFDSVVVDVPEPASLMVLLGLSGLLLLAGRPLRRIVSRRPASI